LDIGVGDGVGVVESVGAGVCSNEAGVVAQPPQIRQAAKTRKRNGGDLMEINIVVFYNIKQQHKTMIDADPLPFMIIFEQSL